MGPIPIKVKSGVLYSWGRNSSSWIDPDYLYVSPIMEIHVMCCTVPMQDWVSGWVYSICAVNCNDGMDRKGIIRMDGIFQTRIPFQASSENSARWIQPWFCNPQHTHTHKSIQILKITIPLLFLESDYPRCLKNWLCKKMLVPDAERDTERGVVYWVFDGRFKMEHWPLEKGWPTWHVGQDDPAWHELSP